MGDLLLSACGPDPIASDEALTAVLGYARARRWFFVRTPSHPSGQWVQVPAYPFGVYDAQPPSPDPGFAWLDVLAADGLMGGLPHDRWESFAAEVHALVPVVDRVLESAAGRAFWDLDSGSLELVELALAAARGTSDPDRAVAVLHHKHPRLFPLTSRRTERALQPVAQALKVSPSDVIHADLRTNADAFAELEQRASHELAVQWGRLRLHDLLMWLTVTHRWADCQQVGSGTLAKHEQG